MKVNPIIATAIVSAVIGLQAWTLLKVVTLAEDVASLKARIQLSAKL